MENIHQPTITEIVCEAVLDNHAVKKAGKVHKIDTSMSLDELKVDSLEKLSLAMDFEDQFSIEIADEEIEKFLTVGDFITYLELAVKESKSDAAKLAAEPVTEPVAEHSVESLSE
jgi:acyl carrier protein